MASDKVKVFNDLNFDEEVVKAGQPVLVDFTAAWCGPCKRLAPIIDELAEELEGRVIIGKLDVDESPMTTAKYGVRSMPTLMVFKSGEQAGQHIGLASKAKLLGLLQEASAV